MLCSIGALAGGAGCGGGDGGGGMTGVGRPSPSLSAVSGRDQRGATGDSVPSPMVVEATREGAPVEGERVVWSLVESPGPGATLAPSTATTDAEGRASARLVLGSAPGDYRVAATLASASDTVFFTATAQVPRIDRVVVDDGGGQSGTVGETLPDSLVARVDDQFGDPLPDAVVRFALVRGASAGASVDPDSVRTGASGRASAALTLGSANGTYRVVASVGRDSAFFSAEGTGGARALLALDSVRPAPLQAGGSATVFGAGFSTLRRNNQVDVDGKAAAVTSATESRLGIRVPTFTDECLPRRGVDVEVSSAGDEGPPVRTELAPSVTALRLSAGEDTVLVGPDAVGCVQLPGSAPGGAEYEVVATTAPDALGTQAMDLLVNGSGPEGAERADSGRRERTRRVRRPPAGGEVPAWQREQHEWDRRMRERGRRWIGEARARARAAPSMSRTVGRRANVAAPGDTATFSVSCTGQPDVTAVARSVSEAAVVFEDTTMASRGVGFRDARYDSIAARFDTLSFAVDTTYFGAPADIDGNGRIVMLFTPAVNREDGNYRDGFIVGFFCSLDLSAGNEAEMFYLVSPDPAGGFTPPADGGLDRGFVRRIIEGTVIHEFQHLINAQIGAGSDPASPSTGGAQAIWLNEGLSHLAEEVGGHAAAGLAPGEELTAARLTADPDALDQFYRSNFRNLSRYLSSPHTGTGPVAGGANFRTRGAAWSFVRYLLDRFVAPGSEHALTRAIVQSSARDGRSALEQAVRSVTGRSVTFEDALTDWNAMFAVEDRTDLADAPRPGLQLFSYQLRAVYGDPAFGSDGSYPLAPPDPVVEVGLDASAVVDADLFTGTGRYVRLVSSSRSAGTGVRLAAGDGRDLPPGVAPRLIVVRTE